MINQYVSLLKNELIKIKDSKFFKVLILDVLSKGSDFLFLPIYLKLLTQEEFGIYTFILYIITTASGIIKLGMDTAASKMYYETERFDRSKMLFSVNSIWFALFILITGISLTTGIDKFVFIDLLNIPLEGYIQIRYFIFIYIFFNLIQTTLNVFYVIDDNAINYQRYNFLRTFFGNSLVIFFLYFFVKENGIYFRLGLESILFSLCFIPLLYRFIKKMKFDFVWESAKHGFQIGLPMVGTLLVGVVYNLSDKYFLQQSSGYETLAVYNLAIFLTLPISLIFMSFNTIWLPKFFREKSDLINFELSNKHFRNLFIFYLVLFLILEFLIFLAQFYGLIDLGYSMLLIIFPFIYLSKVLDNLGQLYNNFIVKWGKTVFNLIITICFSILAFLLNFFFIPKFGIIGAVLVLIILAVSKLLIFYQHVKINYQNESYSKYS